MLAERTASETPGVWAAEKDPFGVPEGKNDLTRAWLSTRTTRRPSVCARTSVWTPVDWAQVRAVKDFYLNIPPMADMQVLWERVARHRPIVLTGLPYSVPEAGDNKREWIRKHIGEHVEVRCCLSREKCLHAAPGDVLIDKGPRSVDRAGGVWITHRSAAETADALRRLGS